jgi:alkylated DNA repair protein alkB family protein 4
VEDLDDVVIRVPLPRRSLLVLTGELRYQWEHAILRKDINTRRIVIAYRELVKLES